MARIRSVKVDQFLDDGLTEVSLEAHFLLLGLPCLADSAGRLEDRPRKIHALIFPYRQEIKVEPLLSELVRSRHIQRYTTNGDAYIQILEWERDQRPHKNEPESSIPPPPQRYTDVGHVAVPGIHESNQGIPEEKSAAVVLGVGSGVRDPDPGPSFPPSAVASAAPGQGNPEPAPTPADTEAPKPEALQEVWNRVAHPKGLQRWSAMGKRKDTAKARLKAEPRLEAWEAFLKAKLAEPFFLGENERRWKADVEWFLRSDRPAQVTDFADSPPPTQAPGTASVVPIRRLVEM